MKQDYKELLRQIGEDEFAARLEELTKTITVFLQEGEYEDTVKCNERILYHVLLDYYSDIFRLEEFHNIYNPKTDKIIAYLIFWIIRRKPIQLTEFSESERDIFVNERFACFLLVNECLWKQSNYKLTVDDMKQVDKYLEMLLYYFKYRQINAQVIEMLIESFKIGRLFPLQ